MKRIGIVVDNKDPEQRGRIKLRILPELENIKEDHLPWAGPTFLSRMGLDTSKGTPIHEIPHIDSMVYCEISEDWTHFDWIEEVPYYRSGYAYTDTTDLLKEYFDEIGEQEYPQPKYSKTPDGVITFHNTETGEQGYYNPNGTQVHLREDGTVQFKNNIVNLELKEDTINWESNGVNIDISDKGSVSIEADNFGILFDNENKKVIITKIENMEVGGASDVAVLFEPLKEILEKLLDHNHIAPTGPTTPAQESSGTPLSSLKGKLQKLKSIIKTD